ncbi:MAG: hypothetical protein JSS66_13795 [Armatimonadetes bacterium]|nr:hypothetical protein [Armatimonadota bacterium]
MLVAMTIVLVLASLLTPVFLTARDEARKVACTQNFKQVNFASTLYQVDYDDRFVVSKYSTGVYERADTDRTWVQLVFPYLRSFASTRCPSDQTIRPGLDPVFDADMMVGDNLERYYTMSTRANTGFNYIYLSPLVREANGHWVAKPRGATELNDPSQTLIFADSVWDVTPNGQPIGGGSYLIVPPCRYMSPGRTDSFELAGYSNDRIYTGQRTWDEDGAQYRRTRFGGIWPWHAGRFTAAMGDGSVKVLALNRASDGCTVHQNWGGLIVNAARYVWDLR